MIDLFFMIWKYAIFSWNFVHFSRDYLETICAVFHYSDFSFESIYLLECDSVYILGEYAVPLFVIFHHLWSVLFCLSKSSTMKQPLKIPFENKDELFTWTEMGLDLEAVKVTILALIRETEEPRKMSQNRDSSGTTSSGSETFFLLAILLGTCILLYFFPPGPWIFLTILVIF